MRKQRVISAIILIAAVVAATAVGNYALGALILAFIVIGIFEIYRAFENKGFHPVKPVGFCFAGIFAYQVMTRSPDVFRIYPKIPFAGGQETGHGPVPDLNIFGLCFTILTLALLTVLVFRHDKYSPADGAVTLFGALYVMTLTSFGFSIRELDGGNGGLFMFILAMASNISADTMAYEIGSRFGKHKLMPSVSPKKTVEGSVGAFAGAVAGSLILGFLFVFTGWYTGLRLYWYPVIGLAVGFLSQAGDLSASVIKRYAGVKDFGNIIPGHGGVLDRIDSLMFVFPAVYYFCSMLI